MTEAQPVETENQLKLAIPDVYLVAQAVEVAIKKKIYTEEEIKKIYGPWSNVMRFCEDIKRKTEIENIYKKEEEKTEEKVEELEKSSE